MDFIVVLIIVSLFFTSSAQQLQSNVSPGSSLTPGTNSTWLSRSGLYAFGFYKQGNGYAVGVFLAGIPEKTVVWTANRDDLPFSSNATLHFSDDGRLVVQSQGQVAMIADSSGSSSASMLNSGNFVIYNRDQRIIWQSFEHPTDTLLPSQRFVAVHELFSSILDTDHQTGIFRLKMQSDGNLVQYPMDTQDDEPYAYFDTETYDQGDNVSLNFDADGHLYLLNSTGYNNIKNLTDGGYRTGETLYLLRLDADGILRLYSHNLAQNGNWSVEWQSSRDPCDPKGLCGLNGYCVLNDQQAACECLPGFGVVHPGNWTAGCERNFTTEGCKDENEDFTHTIQELASTIWENVSYYDLSVPSAESCKQACLEDCSCEAALFKDSKCSKQRLPLRYGRRRLSDSNVALIKVTTSTPTGKGNMPTEHKKEHRVDILIIGALLVAFGCIMLIISGVVFYRDHFHHTKLSSAGNGELIEDFALRSFTFPELEIVTNDFKEEVGRGSFGAVYKGVISNGQKVVAVKRLEKMLAEGEREFQTEMKVIGRTHHRNLVRLLGYCHDGSHRLLVYEFMSNGSLADVLFTPEKQPSWDERMDIARNVARGILYLHEECERQIIHCDIKPQNILMDENGCAKISDFGLAKLLKADQTKTFTGIRGTRGYVAPEWHRKLPITVKADVYSYGIMLFEIICCRKSVDWNLPEEEAVLEEWAYRCFEADNLAKLIGYEEFEKKKVERMVKLGLWCVQEEPSLRPSMKKVLLMLEGTVDIPIPPSPNSFLSTY